MVSSRRIDDIEVLRAIAIILVAVHHAQGTLVALGTPLVDSFFAYFNGSHGVDLFFAVSGFVIARDLIPKIAEAGSDRTLFFRHAIAFWIRRAFRLLPAAWICLGFIIVASLWFGGDSALGSFRANFAGAVSAMLQVANLHFAFNFGSPLGLGATYHFWTLSLEEQFYLALPFILFFGRRAVPWLVAALVLVQLFSVRPTLYHWMFRTDAMFLGVLLAWWSRDSSHAMFEPLFLGASAGARWFSLLFLCLALAVVAAEPLRIVEHRLSLVALISVLLVFIASYDNNYLIAPGLLKQGLVWLGSRSYAVYLWHVPVFLLTEELRVRHASTIFADRWILGFAAIALLVLISELNFRLIESPLRLRGKAVAQRWSGPS